ncbi:MAG: hypothetical protein ACKOJF_30465, partial [Planctomycetaceae bacterium]
MTPDNLPAIELETTGTVPGIGLPATESSSVDTALPVEQPLRVADELLIEFASPESLFPPEAVTREWSGELSSASSPRPTESQSEQRVPEQLPTVAEPTATTESSTEPNSAKDAQPQDPADDPATSSAETAPEPAPGQDAAETEAPSVNSATQPIPVDEVPVTAAELPTPELPTAVESGRSLED